MLRFLTDAVGEVHRLVERDVADVNGQHAAHAALDRVENDQGLVGVVLDAQLDLVEVDVGRVVVSYTTGGLVVLRALLRPGRVFP